MVKRFSVWLVDLNPTKGSEQSGTRPVLVLSPDEMNTKLKTAIVAPMTTSLREWPTRVRVEFKGKAGDVALDQIRTLDQTRMKKYKGDLDPSYHQSILSCLSEIFAE